MCVSEQLKVTVANPANPAETGRVAGHTSMVYECETSQRDTKTRLIRHGGDHGESRSYLQVQREEGMPDIDNEEDDREHGTGLEQQCETPGNPGKRRSRVHCASDARRISESVE